jgi:hypothetical protein
VRFTGTADAKGDEPMFFSNAMLLSNAMTLASIFIAVGLGMIAASVVGAVLEDRLEARDEREAEEREHSGVVSTTQFENEPRSRAVST